MRYIGVLDCNNFFVSCERLFRPDLENRPVIVLSSNDGCVVARSQEIKDIGIPMGVPYFQIKDIIKDTGTTVFSSHFALYRDISARVFAAAAKLCPELEIYSIDEAFFAIEATADQEVAVFIAALRSAVERSVGIPVSIGVGGTKTQAKLLNNKAKRTSREVVVPPDQFLAVCGTTTLVDVWGVGRALACRFQEQGIHTVADLVALDMPVVKRLYGVVGLRLWAELRGEVAHPLTSRVVLPQSITSTRSFAQKITTLPPIADALAYHVRRVATELRTQRLCASTVTVYLVPARDQSAGAASISQQALCAIPMAETTALLQLATSLLQGLYCRGVRYSKTGVMVGGLLPATAVSPSLFMHPTLPSKAAALDEVMDLLQQRHGRDIVTIGRQVAVPVWRAKQATMSPRYTTAWSDVPTVYAKEE